MRTPDGQYTIQGADAADLAREIANTEHEIARLERRLAAYRATLSGNSTTDPRALNW